MVCAFCSGVVTREGSRGPVSKYCSDACRNRAKWERQKKANPCPQCGGPMARRSNSSASDPRCNECRIEHGGAGRYRKGCRCDVCKKGHRDRMRVYVARRKAEGNPIVPVRRTETAQCAHCGKIHPARTDNRSRLRFCSDICAREFQGWDGVPRDRWRPPAKLRKLILDRDSYTCQLCLSPVRLDVDPSHPRYPNLDHIVPRSRGGSDEESNLRCACRQCNTQRGSNVDWVPSVVSEVA